MLHRKVNGYVWKIYIWSPLGFQALRKKSKCSIQTRSSGYGWLVNHMESSHQFCCNRVWRSLMKLLQAWRVIWWEPLATWLHPRSSSSRTLWWLSFCLCCRGSMLWFRRGGNTFHKAGVNTTNSHLEIWRLVSSCSPMCKQRPKEAVHHGRRSSESSRMLFMEEELTIHMI